MKAMLLRAGGGELELVERAVPVPGPREVLLKISVCGVCRTDLHILDGELPQTRYPIVPGHQVVGHIEALGDEVSGLQPGQRVGVPWLGGTCGHCEYCRDAHENLCPDACFTGCQRDGGFAEYCCADYRFCLPLPDVYPDLQAAPLLCAGLIGYRAWRMCGKARRIGFFGFGASAHILTQLAVTRGDRVFAFTRADDDAAQEFALSLGACWAGGSDEDPPETLDAAIIFAPVGALVPRALSLVRPGGRVVCAGIHMSEIPAFSYDLLWQERSLLSVANLTRRDGIEFMQLAATAGIETEVHPYPLEQAQRALEDLRAGSFTGAAVLVI